MERKTIISVKDLVKNYGNFEAVKGISFDVYENEIFGMLGPNGAGKSTTLEIIETLREKTSGQVTVDGHDPTTHFHFKKITNDGKADRTDHAPK